MSVGGLVGAVLGGVVGFFIGGPAGALYGAGLGFGLGMMIDPMAPDVPTPGAPLPMGAEIMPAVIGDPLSDLTGTAKITGHLLCFGKERTVTITQEQEGGKGTPSPDPTVTGYRYYMSWAVGIVAGPIDTLYAIYRGDDVVWEGELNIPTDSDSYGEETVLLSGFGPPLSGGESFLDPFPDPEDIIAHMYMGSATFYFGTADQIANSKVGEIIGDATLNSPYRHFCWCFFDDCYIGTFNRCPTMRFVLRKSPTIDFAANNVIQTYDYNPAHAIWYILHTLAGLPDTWLHSADFVVAASKLSAEGRGISCLFTSQQSTLAYLETINNHIDGIVRYGADGKFHPKLIRDDYIVDDLPVIDEDVMLEDPTLNRKSWIDTINEMKVQYTEINRDYGFPQGEWKAPMSFGDNVYVYDIDYKAVINISTSALPPTCLDSLVITEHDLDYDMGYGNPGAQRGGYCMDPDGDRLWYLIRDGLNCELVEIDISGYYMEIADTTNFSSLLAPGEKISDGCSDGTYTYWSTTLVAGRVIKIKNSDHSISLDVTFNYPIVGTGGMDSCIESLTIEGSSLYWIYSRDHIGCFPEYNACAHWVKSGNDLVQDFDVIYCGSGLFTPYYQNFIRYFDDYLYIHRSYHPFCGSLSQTNLSFIGSNVACQLYLQNIMGIHNDQIFILTYDAPWATYLKCVSFASLNDLSSIDVSQYTGHSYEDQYMWSATSAMSDHGAMKVISLFRYDIENNVNIVTCFGANELLTKLSESAIQSNKQITYGD